MELGLVLSSNLHFALQMLGQKNLTFFPVTGSLRLHRLLGFVETHVEQSLSSLLLNRNVTLSSHSPRSCDAVGDSDLHLVLQMLGQKSLTFFPVTGSFFLHRFLALAETHLAQFFLFALLKRKVLLSSHSPRSSISGDAVGDLDLHWVLQIVGQKKLTYVPVIRSFFLHRLVGFSKTHSAQFFFFALLKRNFLLSSHLPRASVGEDVGEAVDLHLVLQIDGQKNLTFFPVTGSLCLHRLLGFVKAHVEQSLSSSLLKRNVSLSSHSPRSLVGEDVCENKFRNIVGDAVGDSVGVVVGVVVGLLVGFVVGVRVGKYVGEVNGDCFLLCLLISSPLLFSLLFLLLLLFESFSELPFSDFDPFNVLE
jgi:hypothetical protein